MSSRSQLQNKKRIVIKIGTSTITHPTGKLNLNKIDKIARQLTDLINEGKDVILVTSGAIAVGVNHLQLSKRPIETSGKQAVAAVGQAVLMQIYNKIFGEYNQKLAQVLLTKYTLEDERRIHYANNTFNELFHMGVLPVVNENDTVAIDEIEFGDNDTLSAIVAQIVHADLLILLSDIDGLYTEDPKKNKNAELIEEIYEINTELENMAGEAGSDFGTGGMNTKISAAKIATQSGVDMVIANGADIRIIEEILQGKKVGTLFVAR